MEKQILPKCLQPIFNGNYPNLHLTCVFLIKCLRDVISEEILCVRERESERERERERLIDKGNRVHLSVCILVKASWKLGGRQKMLELK